MATTTKPQWRRLLWFAALWLASVVAMLAVVYTLRYVFGALMTG